MQERAQLTQSRIIAAALHEFADKGFHGARVDVITSVAGVNKQRIYAYFGSKEGLFCAVLNHVFGLVAKEERAFLRLGEADIPYLGEIILRQFLAFHRAVPQFWRLLAWENLDGGGHVTEGEASRREVYRHLESLYAQGQTKGHFNPAVSFRAVYFTLMAVAFFAHANQQTLERTLHMNLKDPEGLTALIQECLQLYGLAPRLEVQSC